MKDHGEIPAYVHGFDVCIVPTARTSWGMKCRPLKLMEYLAAGKPVVATETPASLAFANAVTIAQDTDSWVAGINSALRDSDGGAGAASKAAIALESWDDLAVRFWRELRSRGLAASRMTSLSSRGGSAQEAKK
jgi:glycosyltransferase involved in cell wall biosynthesis